MANYKLALDQGKGLYKEIKWNTIKKITLEDSYKLKSLVEFTTLYDCEDSLRDTLLKQNLITVNDVKNKLCIVYRSGGKLKKLLYGISYGNSKKYFDEDRLYYEFKLLANDIVFLEKLTNHYRNSYLQGSNIVSIRNYINSVKRKSFDPYDTDIYSVINDFFNKEIYKINKTSGEVEINYKTFRDLAMFIYNYNQKVEKDKDNQLKINEKGDSCISEDIVEEPDHSWVFMYAIDGEPVFPPNSEEEKRYIEYMESLPTEDSDAIIMKEQEEQEEQRKQNMSSSVGFEQLTLFEDNYEKQKVKK